MPIPVEADLVERATIEMPTLEILSIEAELTERSVVQMPQTIVEEVELA